MRLGRHGALTGTLLFVMNVFKKNEDFAGLRLVQKRKQEKPRPLIGLKYFKVYFGQLNRGTRIGKEENIERHAAYR